MMMLLVVNSRPVSRGRGNTLTSRQRARQLFSRGVNLVPVQHARAAYPSRGMSDSTPNSESATLEPTATPAPVVNYETPPPPTMWQRIQRTVKRLGPAGPLAVLAGTFPPIGGFILIGFISRLAPWLQ